MYKFQRAPVLLLLVVCLAACSKKSTSPSPAIDVGGFWAGFAGDNTGPGTLSFSLSQTGASVTGAFSATASGGLSVGGSVTGTVSGDVFDGKFTGSHSGCQFTMDFTAQANDTLMVGAYTGTNSCSGPVTDGWFQLTR